MRAVLGRVVAFLLALGLVATATIMAAQHATAATMYSCYVAGSYGDTHNPGKHGDVFASVDYNWYEEVILRQVDGVKFFGTVGWDKVGTRPTWIRGC